MTDAELIAAAHDGDADAWRTLYQRWLPWVWRAAYSLVQDTHVAEDITSEAMTAWVRRITDVGGDAPQVAAWLRTVVRNKAADHHRRAGRTRRVLQEASAIADQRQEPHRDRSMPSCSIEQAESQAEVKAALDQLSDDYRLALEWKYGESLSVQEISQRLGVTEKSAEAILYRARKGFRHHYQRMQNRASHQRCPNADKAMPEADNPSSSEITCSEMAAAESARASRSPQGGQS
ncbi:MAG: sigma-70 family RNA polymerase sigma factor [Planctomycetota bacterium]